MSWFASQRYGLAPAPRGLALVQDFLNTVGIGDYGSDLLADGDDAREWATKAVRNWSAERGIEVAAPILSDADVSKLAGLRDTIAELVAADSVPTGIRSVSASFTLSDRGEVRLEPVGSDWRWLASALWAEILLSQQTDTWRRIKRCRNPLCASTFYDRSKNNSGVWHDVKTCGNAANLRASRARRRQRDHTD
ncbi:peptide chain release factor 2 [Mycobacterium asiaticum]|uniref:Peptide chain release factor 2 n=1 Tax=Mycobacterium asiaticum TaxID=1790 RepID=A0A1A3NUY4_MYCAS|nr:peptide chain release factor 2 [Mycobacterium asiaticum]